MKKNLEYSGSRYGMKFGELKHMPNSHSALEAAEYARTIGKIDDYHKSLMIAYFRDSRDIGNINVLIELAEELDMNGDEMYSAIKEKKFKNKLNEYAELAHSMNINSTPTFIINNEHTIVGAQPIEVFKEVFEKIYR